MARTSGAREINLEPPMPAVPETKGPENDNAEVEIPVTWEGVEQEDGEKSDVHEKPILTSLTAEQLAQERAKRAAEYEKLHGTLEQNASVVGEILEVLKNTGRGFEEIGRQSLRMYMQTMNVLFERNNRRIFGPLAIVLAIGSADRVLDMAEKGELRHSPAEKILVETYGPAHADELLSELESAGRQYVAARQLTQEVAEVIGEKVERKVEDSGAVKQIQKRHEELLKQEEAKRGKAKK